MDEYRPQMRKFYYNPAMYDTYLDQLGISYPGESGGRRVAKRKIGVIHTHSHSALLHGSSTAWTINLVCLVWLNVAHVSARKEARAALPVTWTYRRSRNMRGRYPCGGMHRREFFGATAVPFLVQSALGPRSRRAGPIRRLWRAAGRPRPLPGARRRGSQPGSRPRDQKGPRGDPGDPQPGTRLLTGADHPVEAWRTFVQPGESVGIKVVPNGYPGAHTSPELVLEVIDGLRAAGIKLKDMVVFDRYGLEFREAAIRRSCPTASPGGA